VREKCIRISWVTKRSFEIVSALITTWVEDRCDRTEISVEFDVSEINIGIDPNDHVAGQSSSHK
jgi:hypothetical protein